MDLVTGGSGFVGHHVVSELIRRGRDVRIYDRQPLSEDALHTGASHEGHDVGRVEMVIGDILDAHELRRALGGCRTVYHLAADPNLWHRDRDHFDRVNRGGTELVLTLAREAGVERVVHTSTEAVLTPRRSKTPITETVSVDLEDMVGDYCRSKLRAEQAALRATEAGLPVVIVNPAMPLGPGDRTLTPPTRMLVDFLSGRTPAYLDAYLSFVDVRDAALGHVRAAERGVPGRRHLLVGGTVRAADFFTVLAKVANRRPPRMRVPYALALGIAHGEAVVARWTGRAPRAPVAGVRLAGRQRPIDGTWSLARLGLQPRALEVSLEDAVQWLRMQGLVPSLEPSPAEALE
jgi:dihydroflavonol-4-reductase